jgi:deoxyribodipyrimidine photo-lyase
MRHEPYLVREDNWNLLRLPSEFYTAFKGPELPLEFKTRNPVFQEGGEYWGWKYLKSFIETRHPAYSSSISKPEASRRAINVRFKILSQGCTGKVTLFKNLKMSRGWNLSR